MKKLATIKRLALQIEYHIEIEDSYPGFITRAVYEEVYDDKPNKHPIHLRQGFTMNMGMRSGFEYEFAAFVSLSSEVVYISIICYIPVS